MNGEAPRSGEPARRNAGKVSPISRIVAVLSVALALVVFAARERASATPVFAQAYGLSCSACHAQVPVLNAFGRYIQRTGYAALDAKALKHAFPVFLFDTGTTYTHQSGQPASDGRVTGPFDRTILQANSALGPDVTYKIEQVVADAGQAGFLDQGWFAFHNFFDHHGHLFVGKLAAINLEEFGGPDILADVNDAGQSRVPNVAVGVHNYALDYELGRWGAKFNYVRGKTLVQVAYLGNPSGTGSFGDAYDFSRAADTSFQWRVAYADPAKPYEVGVFGESGAFGFTGSQLLPGLNVDNYTVVAPYISKDPRPGSPGFRFEYSTAFDSNPGYVTPSTSTAPLRSIGSTTSSWMIGSVYQMVLHDHGVVNLTYYHTNQALSENGFTGVVQSTGPATGGGPAFSYAINPYTRIYTAMYVAKNQRPAFSISMWFTPPLWPRLK
jgi:hypothetical protein